jgi:NhaP-type Na+/H+ and K+/H+ antiporter
MIDPIWIIKPGHPELHCICSMFGVLGISWFAYYNNPISRPIAYLIASTVIWSAGFLKEFTDADGFNMYELTGDTFGVILGIVFFMIMCPKVRWEIRSHFIK